MRGLKGKVAVVTGGLGDLGYATAQRLGGGGCKGALLDLKADDEDRGKKIGAESFQVDITDEASLARVFQEISSSMGFGAILINTAACFLFKGVEATLEDFERICTVNIAGTSLVTKRAVEHMKEAGSGSI